MFQGKKKGSGNRKKAINKLGRKHLKVTRQRQDFAIKTAPGAVKSNDFVAYEELQVKNMVKNHKLAKSISDAAWSQFAQWLEYVGKVYGKTICAVAPQYTSQECSNCSSLVKKTLSTRTHICDCGTVLDRDHNAALNIWAKGLKQVGINLNTVGHTEINACGQTVRIVG
ncbi:RNA-guided endonuclease InsQ/TnpB family protein [Microcoleus sp. BR0-C5]|uniref:RNA-guided endonuclease InsQ/TnpB family protein n=1 Tax=Microcoleus sp. BR0-C5 TaxID=2818713 RepID=UPI004040B9F4